MKNLLISLLLCILAMGAQAQRQPRLEHRDNSTARIVVNDRPMLMMGAYECFDEYICRGHIWCREQTDATEQEKNFCKRLGRKVNEDDIALVKKYPVLNESNVYRTVAAACYTVAFSYMREGDRINAALWLHRAMQMNPDIIYERNFEKIKNFIMRGTASF